MERKKTTRLSTVAVLLVVAALCLGAFLLARVIAQGRPSMLRGATQTPAFANQHIEVLGNGILYYDGASLHALDDRARQMWSYSVGIEAGFSVGTGGVAAWSNEQLSLLSGDQGLTLYSGNAGGPVLDARIGTQYAAAQTGTEHNSTLVIMDHGGRQVDKIELPNQTVLDFGFFNGDTLVWVMYLNTEGTVPTCSITTYRPNRMQTGTITDENQVLYEVVFQSTKIRAVGTDYIKDYEYTTKEIPDNRMLVYGWYLMGIDDRSDNPLMAFVPVDQADSTTGVNDLRMIRGQTDQWVRLPYAAHNVLVLDDAVYAFNNQYAMITRMGNLTPTSYMLPIYADRVLGVTENRSAVVSSGGSIYLLPLG